MLADDIPGPIAVQDGCERDHAQNAQRNRQAKRDEQNLPPGSLFCDLVGLVQAGHDGPGSIQRSPSRTDACQCSSSAEDGRNI